jgi:alkylation response protein AidB-like acyl-CoA dehydrogenase
MLDKLPGVTVQPMVSMLGDYFHTESSGQRAVPKRHLLGKKNEASFISTRRWSSTASGPASRSHGSARGLRMTWCSTQETRRDGTPSQDPASGQLVESAIEIEACRQVLWSIGWKIDKDASHL